jgi:hypothetical protein
MQGDMPERYEWFERATAGVVAADPGLGVPLSVATARKKAWWWPSGFAEWFVVSQTLFPALLFLPGSQAFRFPLRVGAYGISLFAFAMWWFDRGGRPRGQHPARRWLGFVLLWLVIMIAHPLTANLFIGMAQVALYFAIFCPVFWASSFVTDRQQLIRALIVLMVCNGINSAVGVLQVYNPDRWMPRQLSSVYLSEGGQLALAASTFIGPNGRPMLRPPGLFDSPGAVAGAGEVAAMLGLVFFLEPLVIWQRVLALAFGVMGIAAVYLSHVRAAFVATLAMMVAYFAILAIQRERVRAIGFAGLGFGLLAFGFSFAVMLGGTSIQDRFSTLIQGDPRDLYLQSRGAQVEYALTDLADQYPVGAGLGRWGMMSSYLITPNDEFQGIFAEVQPNAWVLDGGLPLLTLYTLALVVTLFSDLKLIRSLADRQDRLCASVVVATNLGTMALVLTFIPFGTAVGVQFWFLEGILRGAMADSPRLT